MNREAMNRVLMNRVLMNRKIELAWWLRTSMLLAALLLSASCISGCSQEKGAEDEPPESLANAEAEEPEPGAPGSPENKLPSSVNPNGDSELAVVMRQMHQSAKTTREAVVAGDALPPLPEEQTQMLSAWPTDPEVRGPEFDALARDYLGVLEDLHTGADDPQAQYNELVDACVGCHQSFCPGPIATIEKLRVVSAEE